MKRKSIHSANSNENISGTNEFGRNLTANKYPDIMSRSTSSIDRISENATSFSNLYPLDDLNLMRRREAIENTQQYNEINNEHLMESFVENLVKILEDEEEDNLHRNNRNERTRKKSFNSNILWIILIISAICVTAFWSKTNIKPVLKNIKDFREKFPYHPNEIWFNFETIIHDVLIVNPSRPAVFLLLYTEKSKSIDKLVDHLAEYATEKLQTNEDYIKVDEQEFCSTEAVKDYGYLIDKYKEPLIKKRVMVLKNLQNIHGRTAQALHSMCDEFTPLVEQVVYIFTLKVDHFHGKPEIIAEDYLKKSWNDLDDDILIPLITRVTSTVLKIIN